MLSELEGGAKERMHGLEPSGWHCIGKHTIPRLRLLLLPLLQTGWSQQLARHSQYTEAEVRPVAATLAALQRKASGASLVAVHKKVRASEERKEKMARGRTRDAAR